MTYLNRCQLTIPGRGAKTPVIDRAAYLRRYLAERAAFSWTPEYRARQAELAALEGK